MTDFSRDLEAFSTSRTTEKEVVLIDVGSKSIQPDVVRDGIAVGTYTINTDIFDEFFGGRPPVTQKVVSQSIPPGTPVPEGTAVELQLAEPGALPIGVVEGVYLTLEGQTMEQVHQTFLAQNPDLVRVVARNPEGETVTPADEALVRQAFNSRQLPIVNEPGRDLAAAMQTLRVAQNFGA